MVDRREGRVTHRHSEGGSPLEEPAVRVHTLAESVALAADLDGLGLLQQGELLLAGKHLLLQKLPLVLGVLEL